MADPTVPSKGRNFRHRLRNPFYAEEADDADDNVNRFEDQNTDKLKDDNPIESTEQVQLDITPTKNKHPYPYFIFVPDRVSTGDAANKKIKVALLFCVGDQMNRAGLRQVFADKDAVLITIPGWEKSNENPPRDDPDKGVLAKAYGIGISDEQVKQLCRTAGLQGKPEISTIAGYSTGYRGMIGSVNGGVINVKNVRTMIFYDCLYIADDYFPLGLKEWRSPKRTDRRPELLAALRTAGAVDKVLRDSATTGAKAQIVIYDVTPSGTTHYKGTEKLPGGAPPVTGLAVKGHTVVDLKSLGSQLQMLQMARLLDEGDKDDFFDKDPDIPKSFRDVIGKLKTRGLLQSSKSVTPVGGVGARTPLEKWASDIASLIAAVRPQDRVMALRMIHKNRLMGWVPNEKFNADELAGEMQHDQFIPEFAGEFLVPR